MKSEKGFTLIEMLLVLMMTMIIFIFMVSSIYEKWQYHLALLYLEQLKVEAMEAQSLRESPLGDDVLYCTIIITIDNEGNSIWDVRKKMVYDHRATIKRIEMPKNVRFSKGTSSMHLGFNNEGFNKGIQKLEFYIGEDKYIMTNFFREGVIKFYKKS